MANTTACKAWKATSNGAWAGDNPVEFALPLLIIQLILIVSISRLLAYFLRPLHQPRVIAEICGGIILGASAFGYIPNFTEHIFPPASITVLTTVANLGLLFFLFMVGLELDLRSLKKTGRPAMTIAAVGIAAPFALGAAASFAIREVLGLSSKFGPFVVFMGVAMSITAFPVLARILAERKLLTTDVGQMAMSAAAVNDVLAWVLLALAVALSASDSSPAVVAWILLCGAAFVLVMLFAVQPAMAWVCRPVVDNEPIPEWIVALTLVGVLVSGFVTDVIGIHGIFGSFMFGLVLPKDGPYAHMVIEKIEDMTSIVFLPLYFAASGLSVKLQSISDSSSAGLVFLVIGVACVGKIGGTLLAALAHKMPFRKALVMGILMNTKGLVELIVLNIGLQKEVINQEIYTIMVIMALVTTFMTTPLVMWLYEPAREKIPYTQTTVEALPGAGAGGGCGQPAELRLLVCVHGMRTIPGMLNLMEVSRGARGKKPFNAFMLHLVEFSERSSAIMMVTRVRRDGKPFFSKEAEREGRDQVAVAFQAYAALSKVAVQAMTAISAFSNMHDDVCSTAADKRANLIVLPYHKYLSADGSRLETGVHGFLLVNQNILRTAPCSVAVLVDRGLGGVGQRSPGQVAYRVAVLFFGGPDDREALALALRIAQHPGIELTVTAFFPVDDAEVAITLSSLGGSGPAGGDASSSAEIQRVHSSSSFIIPTDKLEIDGEARLDAAALLAVKALAAKSSKAANAIPEGAGEAGEAGEARVRVALEEREVGDAKRAALDAARDGAFDLLIVGRGRRPAPLVALATHALNGSRTPRHGKSGGAASEQPVQGLGSIGDALVGQESEGRLPSLLIVQQHNPALVKKGKLATAVSGAEDSSHGWKAAVESVEEEGEALAKEKEGDIPVSKNPQAN